MPGNNGVDLRSQSEAIQAKLRDLDRQVAMRPEPKVSDIDVMDRNAQMLMKRAETPQEVRAAAEVLAAVHCLRLIRSSH